MNIQKLAVTGEEKISLSDFECQVDIKGMTKEDIQKDLSDNLKKISKLQDKLFSEKKEGLLVIFQGMDAGGKDGAIRHVLSGINPQGVDVCSFKKPSTEDLLHDYLWRVVPSLPERGKIAIFNRSYYEDVLVVKVRELHKQYTLAKRCITDDFFDKRYKQIVNFEDYLWENGIRVVKIFLNLSANEQKKRLLERIDDETKNWKFSTSDIEERQFWGEYQKAYQKAINNTATKQAPWYVVPADKKPVARLAVSEIILKSLLEIDPEYPVLPDEVKNCLAKCKASLLNDAIG